jgi:transposase-like protein
VETVEKLHLGFSAVSTSRQFPQLWKFGVRESRGLEQESKWRYGLPLQKHIEGCLPTTRRPSAVNKITRFVLWLCRKFTRQELEQIITELQDILSQRDPEVKPRDDFRQQHPHYREFHVDPLAPLTDSPAPTLPLLDWKQLCVQYQQTHHKPLSKVQHRGGRRVPQRCRCLHCGAPSDYLYFNNGKSGSQLLCKVCSGLSAVEGRYRPSKTRYWCPHCQSALYQWKQEAHCTIYKCPNDKCPHYLQQKRALNPKERLLQLLRSSQFKLRYQYREYHFSPTQLAPSAPHRPLIDLNRIHQGFNVVGLVLAFHVSFALSSRKTALVLRQVFDVHLSYQTVLNYAEAAAYYCHLFNARHKAPLGDTATGDETYIHVSGKNHYAFLFLDPQSHQITSYHVTDQRDALGATTSMREAIRTLPQDQSLRFITDGNPSYVAALHFINQQRGQANQPLLTLRQVIGLQNLDDVSQQFRPFKQLIERLNRTYKYHVRSACGFATRNGAVALTTLFVTYYNFLRPHMALKYRCPVPVPDLDGINTLQGKWIKILQLAFAA